MPEKDPSKPIDPQDRPPRDTRESPADNPDERPDTKSREEVGQIRPNRRP